MGILLPHWPRRMNRMYMEQKKVTLTTSVPSEQIFLAAVQIFTDRRNRNNAKFNVLEIVDAFIG